MWNLAWDINRNGEVVWFADALGASDIVYMRRFNVGDVNCDATIDAFDIEPFILALFDRDSYIIRYPGCDLLLADVNSDGVVNAFDIEPFINLLFG